MFQDGQIFDDFEILGRLGRSGSGVVYKARQVSGNRLVALKTLQGAAAADPEFCARFCRDAKVAAALSHPDLAQVYAAGETGGVHWVAMEFVEGTDAQARLKRKGRLALPEAVAIVTHLATVLDYAWRKARLIHRDIRPDHIFLSKKSEVKLGGLGFATSAGEMQPFAANGSLTGTAHYVSPEQAEGKKDVDLRADIYSLGCTLFHFISGEPPYQGDTAMAVILHHVTMPVPELRAVCPGCPAEISRVVMKMMHKQPAGRHQNYDELIADLRLCYEAITSAPAPAPKAAAAPAPARERIVGAVPAAETIKAVVAQPPAAAKPVGAQRDHAKEPPAVAVVEVAREETPVVESRRSLKKPLLIAAGALLAGIVSLVCFLPGKKQEQLSEAQRADIERAARKGAGNPIAAKAPAAASANASSPPKKPAPGSTPLFSRVAPTKPTPAKVASATPTPAPVAAPAPAAPDVPVPPPVPVPAAPQSATAKWLAEQEPQWLAAFASEAGGPFEKGAGDLKAQYLASVEREIATLSKNAERNADVAFRAERARLVGGGAVPAEDESMAPAALRTMRANYRAAFAKLDKERFAKAKIVHARTDAILAQMQAALTQRKRPEEAQEIASKRDALRTAWLKPPEGSVEAVPEAPVAAAEPMPPKPAPLTGPPPPKAPKLAPRDLVERLLAMGATISVGHSGGLSRVNKMADLPGDKFAIIKVEFPPHEGLSAADLDLVEQLTDVEDVQLTGVPATDATLKLLRGHLALRSLGLRDLEKLTVAGFRAVAAMPALKTLAVRGPISTESLTALNANRKLDSLALNDVTFTEQDFAAIAGIPSLKTFSITTRDPVVPAAWGRLAGAKKLGTLTVEKTPKNAEVIAQIARISSLTSLSLGDVTVADADLAPLGSLNKLGTLRTAKESTLDGSVFAAWPTHLAMKTLTIGSTSSVSDKALRAISTAFPKLTRLDVTAKAGSVTPSGLVHLQKLKHLDFLTFSGDAVDGAGLNHLAVCPQITHLGIGSARVAETDVALLAKIAALRELEWNNPPVTPVALKGFAKLRGLAQFKIGTGTKPEVADKLSTALPNAKIVP